MNTNQIVVTSLRDKQVQQVLNRLHRNARGDMHQFLRLVPRILMGFIRGRSIEEIATPALTKYVYAPISPQQGKFIYQTARAIGAKRIVEFGTSFGISTIYLAAAVKDNLGEIVISTEMEPYKHEHATKNLTEAGLDDVTDVRLGDALETLKETPQPLDMIFLDGWKDLYMPILEILKPRLRNGAVVLADNINIFKKSLEIPGQIGHQFRSKSATRSD